MRLKRTRAAACGRVRAPPPRWPRLTGVGRCWYPSRSTPSASSWDPRPGDWAARYLEGILNWPLCALRLLDTLYKLFFSAPIGTSVQSSKSSTGLPLKDSLDGVEITRVNVIVHIQFFEKERKPASWQHPEVPGARRVLVPRQEDVRHMEGCRQQRPEGQALPHPTSPWLIIDNPRRPRHAEMSPILKLEALTTPTAVFVGIARSKRSSRCRIMPSNTSDLKRI